MGRLSAIVLPMGGHKEEEGKKELSPEPEGDEDGLKETFQEMKSALDSDDDDAAMAALKSFIEQCCAKMDY